MTEKRTLNLVQLLRGLASLLVVLMHATATVKDAERGNFAGGFFAFGGAGVDIFFVLSGFIITYTSRNSLGAAKNFFIFLRRRFVRIFPAYWIIITIFLAIQLALPSFYRTQYQIGFMNLFGTYLLFPSHNMINGVSWTLSYELFFYLLFSLAFIIRNKIVLLILALIYVSILTVLPMVGYHPEFGSSIINLVGFPMNIEFFMGISAALIIPKISFRTALFFLVTGSIAFITSGILYNNGISVWPDSFNRVLMYGIPSFFIITGIVRYEIYRPANIHNVFINLGEASYSLYLIHLPLVVAGIKILSRYIKAPGLLMQAAVIGLVIFICMLSVIFFRNIERRIINILNGKKRICNTRSRSGALLK